RGHDTHRPGDRHPVGSGCRPEPDHRVRTEPVLARVLFTRPDQLDRTLDHLRDGDGLRDFIAGIATAEASPEIRVVDVYLLRLQAGGARRGAERRLRVLRADPDI